MKGLTAVSLFSGCGGFDWGIQQLGAKIIWANDIDRYAASAYRHLFPQVEFIRDDISNIETFPSADILIGCYPCTGFSEAAKRKWRDGKERDLRSNPQNFLFIQFLRAISIVKPKFIFIENVRGMLSASKGFFIQEQLEGLKAQGFKTKFKLLNAADYGVAQTRRRLFIVGIHESVNMPDFEYEFMPASFGVAGVPYRSMREVIGHLPEWPEGEFSETKFHGHYLTRNRKRAWENPSYTIVANADHVVLHPMGEPMEKVGKDHWKLNGETNRRLSWRECALIQGLPPHIDIDGSLTAKYRVVGNSVPPKMAEIVGKPIADYLNS